MRGVRTGGGPVQGTGLTGAGRREASLRPAPCRGLLRRWWGIALALAVVAGPAAPARSQPASATWGLLLVTGFLGSGPLALRLLSAAVQSAAMAAADEQATPRLPPEPGAVQAAPRLEDDSLPQTTALLLAASAAASPQAASEAAGAVARSLAVVGATRLAVGRARPGAGLGPHHYEPFSGALELADQHEPAAAWASSFPSGHAAVSMALAQSLSRRLPEAAPLLYAWAVRQGLRRVEQAAHWPSDVWASGWLVLQLSEGP